MTIKGRKPKVVDTNVPVVANRRHNESYACVSACAQALLAIKERGIIILDQGGLILTEYLRNCSLAGQPGVGDSFIRWLHDNQGRNDLVQKIAITYDPDAPHHFVEFPVHPELERFDPADRKFIAVASAHPAKPPILQGTDSKWWGWKTALRSCGIHVEYLCPKEIEAAYKRKME